MINLFKKKKTQIPNLSEIHQYTEDLKQITFLRDKSTGDERKRYDDCLLVMQEVLHFLNDLHRIDKAKKRENSLY